MKRILLLPVFLLACFAGVAQQDSTKNNTRYRLDLIEELMTPRIIKAVVDILPETILELKDSRVSTSLLADYFVRFIIDSFERSANQYPTQFHFKAVLRVYDSVGEPVSQLLIVSAEEMFETTSVTKLVDDAQLYRYTGWNYSDEYSDGWSYARVPSSRFNPNFFSVPNGISYTLIPAEELVDICKKKIFQLRKLVKKLRELGKL